MACKKFDVLIALYIEGDLERETRESVRSHLESCAPCEHLRQELVESQHWLKSADMPVPGPDDLRRIRQSVHQRLSEQGRLIESVFRLWDLIGAKLVLAGLTAGLLILLCGGAVWRLSGLALPGRATSSEARVQNEEADAGKELGVQAGPYPGANNNPTGRGRDSDRDGLDAKIGIVTPGGDIGPLAKGNSQNSRYVVPRRRSRLGRPLTNQSSRDELAVQASGLDSAAQAGSVIRIEIQTSDPKIRIIWLTPSPEEPADGLDPVTK